MRPVQDMHWCRWCRETKPIVHDCVAGCTCPPSDDQDWHANECPQFEDCGGWITHEDPPCGGCDRCMQLMAAHDADLARQSDIESPQGDPR